jgi:hypothetical protein
LFLSSWNLQDTKELVPEKIKYIKHEYKYIRCINTKWKKKLLRRNSTYNGYKGADGFRLRRNCTGN